MTREKELKILMSSLSSSIAQEWAKVGHINTARPDFSKTMTKIELEVREYNNYVREYQDLETPKPF
jgi:hypothetical protein